MTTVLGMEECENEKSGLAVSGAVGTLFDKGVEKAKWRGVPLECATVMPLLLLVFDGEEGFIF